MLKETAQLLSTDILGLLDGANVSELLFENSGVSKRRKDLRTRLMERPYGTRHGQASLAVGANQDGGAAGTPR